MKTKQPKQSRFPLKASRHKSYNDAPVHLLRGAPPLGVAPVVGPEAPGVGRGVVGGGEPPPLLLHGVQVGRHRDGGGGGAAVGQAGGRRVQLGRLTTQRTIIIVRHVWHV